MSGIVSGMDYSALFAPAGSTNASTAILNALYSTTPAAPPTTTVSTGSPLLDLKIAQENQTKDVAAEALIPQVSQAITAFKNAVANATSLQSALANPAVQTVLLTANGLTKYIGETALVQKAFLSNPNDSGALVNQMGDGTLLNAVSSYNFAQNGLAALQNASTVSALSTGYATAMWREGLNSATPGLSNALTFLSQASSITSASDILSNSTNFYVVTGALGISTNIVFQDQSAQNNALDSRLNYANFQNTSYVQTMVQQYLISQQSSGISTSGASAGVLI